MPPEPPPSGLLPTLPLMKGPSPLTPKRAPCSLPSRHSGCSASSLFPCGPVQAHAHSGVSPALRFTDVEAEAAAPGGQNSRGLEAALRLRPSDRLQTRNSGQARHTEGSGATRGRHIPSGRGRGQGREPWTPESSHTPACSSDALRGEAKSSPWPATPLSICPRHF